MQRFNFNHIAKHYPAAFDKMREWVNKNIAQEELSSPAFIHPTSLKHIFLPNGFYWLLDFFDEQKINIQCYPNKEFPGVFSYYVSSLPGSNGGTNTNDVTGNRRDCMREAFLAAFIQLERSIGVKTELRKPIIVNATGIKR